MKPRNILLTLFNLKVKTVFLIDSIGALISAVLLFIVKLTNDYFGMPSPVLNFLAIIPIAFCIYSFLCYLFVGERWKVFMKIISGANLVYCCLTAGLTINYYHNLTVLGLAYFFLEIVTICILVAVEINTFWKIE